MDKPRSQKEIADYFQVDRKTVSRAIEKLSINTNLRDYKEGKNTIYKIDRPQPIEFSPLELATLILSQDAILATGKATIGTPFAESAKNIIAKVKKRSTLAFQQRLESLSKVFGSSVIPAKDFSQHFPTIEILIKAISESNFICITYQNLYEKQAKIRQVAPYNVYFDPDGATLKLIGFDEFRKKPIPFSIDHIRKIEILREKFVRPKDFDLRNHLETFCFNGIHGDPIEVTLKVFGINSRIFAERKFHPTQKIIKPRRKTEEYLTVKLKVAEGRGLERFILSWMPDIEVVSPIRLKTKLQETLQSSIKRNK